MPEGGKGVLGEVAPLLLFEGGGRGGEFAREGHVGVGGMGRAVGGVVGGDVLGMARLEVELPEKAFGREDGLAPGGRGELEGVELGRQRGGVGPGVREEVGGGLEEDGVPRVEVGAERGVERGQRAVFIAQVVAEHAELRGKRARLRGPVVAEGDGVLGERPRGEELAPEREQVGAGAVGRRQGDVLEGGVIGAEGDVEGIHRLVEERFEVFLPERLVGDEEAGDEHVFALVGDGLGGAGDHQAQRIQHGQGAHAQRRVDRGDQQPGFRRFPSDPGQDGHGSGACGKHFSTAWKTFFHSVENLAAGVLHRRTS